MLTCQQLTELVTEYLEGRMSFWRRAQFQMHLGMCKRCRAYIHQMKATVRILGRLPSEPVPTELKDELLKRFNGMKPPERR
jgi:predicted anti-sigma-YlaC factor YlaD